MAEFQIPPQTLSRFLYRVRRNYNPNHYHNFTHCCDVFQGMYYLLNNLSIAKSLTKLEELALLVAALGHDMDHPGTNNAFQIETQTELAVRYNDRSPLENHHAASTFAVLSDSHCNILANVSKGDRKRFRAMVVNLILDTDIKYHQSHLDNFIEVRNNPLFHFHLVDTMFAQDFGKFLLA